MFRRIGEYISLDVFYCSKEVTNKGERLSGFMLTTGVTVAIMESTESGQRQTEKQTDRHARRQRGTRMYLKC